LNYNTLEKLPGNTRYYVPHGLEKDFPKKDAHVVRFDCFAKTGGRKKLPFFQISTAISSSMPLYRPGHFRKP